MMPSLKEALMIAAVAVVAILLVNQFGPAAVTERVNGQRALLG